MLEAFNYAAANDYYDEIPQYDDNADGVSHTDPVPNGGDGLLGSDTYLRSPANPDFNNNGIVDFIDLSTFSRFWGLNDGGVYRDGDLTGDANVNLSDLEILALNWLVGQPR